MLTPAAVRTALKDGRVTELLAALAAMGPVTRAELFLKLRGPDQKAVLAAAQPEMAVSILHECDSGSLPPVLAGIDLASIGPALRLIPPDSLADIVLHLPKELSKRLQEQLDPELRGEVAKLLVFDPESAGGVMTPRYLSVPDVVTVQKATELLRTARDTGAQSYVYVVDVNGRLAGVAPLRALLLSPPRQTVGAIMTPDPVRVVATAPMEEVVRLFGEYHYVSVPVVDDKGRIIGVVTSDDAMAAMRRGEERIVHGMTGVDPREALMETLVATRSRLPWITVTIAGGLACAFIAGLFHRTLAETVVVGIFIPIVLALGESVGTQTTSVVLTSFVAGAIGRKEIARFILKELLIGALMGLYAAVVVALASMFWHGNMRLGLVIGGAVAVAVAWAAVLGGTIPSVMRGLRVNPAVASGPLVLALADVSTLLVYLGGAALFMSAR